MEKKNVILGTVLGLFIIGLPYSGGWKKGGIAAAALIIIGVVLNFIVGTAVFSYIADAIGAYLGYRWTTEYNAAIDGDVPAIEE